MLRLYHVGTAAGPSRGAGFDNFVRLVAIVVAIMIAVVVAVMVTHMTALTDFFKLATALLGLLAVLTVLTNRLLHVFFGLAYVIAALVVAISASRCSHPRQ